MLMMGVQEARHKIDAFLEYPGTYFITSAADKGSYGCALLINKKVPYGTNDSVEIFISREHITVSLAEPRKLVVNIDAPYFSCVVFVFHAPCDDSQKVWFVEAAKTVKQFSVGKPSFLFLMPIHSYMPRC